MASLLLAVIYVAFISLGLPDSLLGSAWPTMSQDLNVPVAWAGGISAVISMFTIVSALPFVFVMLLLCVSLYKDLNNDPMLLRHSLANQVLVDSVTTAVTTANEPHEVETIELHTSLSSTTDGDDAAGEGCQDGTDEAAQDPSADIRAVDGAEDALRGSERRPEG